MSNQPLVLVLAAKPEEQFRMLQDLPHVIGNSPSTFVEAAAEASAIFYWSGSRDLLRSVFLASPHVRWVHSRSAGLDSALFPELVSSPVLLTNGSGVFSQSLGEFALAMVLHFAKDFPRMIRNQRARRWEQFDVDEIAGQTAGIVGYGDIGRAVATRLRAMGMKVLALKRHPPATPDPLIDRVYLPTELLELLTECDYVVASAPLTAETHHMLSDAQFAAMKPSAVVINVGRGPVIDQGALVRAVHEKKIRGAGLDVFEQEPIAENDPIWSLENVFISPHCADHTHTWHEQAVRFFLRQYQRFQNGEPLENIVDKNLGY